MDVGGVEIDVAVEAADRVAGLEPERERRRAERGEQLLPPDVTAELCFGRHQAPVRERTSMVTIRGSTARRIASTTSVLGTFFLKRTR